jgi:hypothetical protein
VKCSEEWPGVSGEPSGGKSVRVLVEQSVKRSSRGSSEETLPTVIEMPSYTLTIIFHEGWPL